MPDSYEPDGNEILDLRQKCDLGVPVSIPARTLRHLLDAWELADNYQATVDELRAEVEDLTDELREVAVKEEVAPWEE